MSANPTACGARAAVSGRARLIPFFPAQLSTTIQVWIERSRQRRELGELADRKDHLLADIGLSVEEARREAAKPFWAFSPVRAAAGRLAANQKHDSPRCKRPASRGPDGGSRRHRAVASNLLGAQTCDILLPFFSVALAPSMASRPASSKASTATAVLLIRNASTAAHRRGPIRLHALEV